MSNNYNLTKPAYSIAEILEIIPLGRTKLHAEINNGNLKASKLGKRTVFLVPDIIKYLESLPAKV